MYAPADEANSVYMRAALEEAVKSAGIGEVPIGAVLVHENKIIARSHNHRETWQDPTAHAEMIVIREAAKALGGWRLIDTTLFVTLEPCAMCLGAILLARIPRLVFGARDPKAVACGSVLDFTSDARLNHRIHVMEGVLADESQQILTRFFKDLRAPGLQRS
jgi:tRNA(adenine34) deaminase